MDYFDATGSWYNNTHQSKYDTFSVTLVDRSDVAAGDFDIVFSYGGITWDTGDEAAASTVWPTPHDILSREDRLFQRNRRFWHVLRGARLGLGGRIPRHDRRVYVPDPRHVGRSRPPIARATITGRRFRQPISNRATRPTM